MRNVRAVLDANVLASGLVYAHRPPGQVVSAWWRGEFQLVTSEPIIEEVARTLAKPYFMQRVSHARYQAMVTSLRHQATRVTPLPGVEGVATHPEDDIVLATAIAGRAFYVVTGDRQLQRLGRFGGARIVSARDFIEALQK